MKFQATLRMIWGLAKSPELSMSSEELHMFVEARTGKESLKELTQKERNTVARALMGLKPEAPKGQTGNPVTERQRQKLKELASEAGWDNPARLNGLARKMFGVERVEWLNGAQCSKLIEAMKAMNKRKVGENAEGTGIIASSCPNGGVANGSKGIGSADGSADQRADGDSGR